jgi:hypothetical protein
MSRAFATGLHPGEQAPDTVDSAGACLLVDLDLGALDVESGLTNTMDQGEGAMAWLPWKIWSWAWMSLPD